MKKIKDFFKNLHQRKPYLEPIFISILSAALGFVLNMYTTFLSTNPDNRFWTGWYLWVLIGLLIIVVLYYIFLSTYTNGCNDLKNSIENCKKVILSEYVANVNIQMKNGDVETFKASTAILRKSTLAIDEIFKGAKIDG